MPNKQQKPKTILLLAIVLLGISSYQLQQEHAPFQTPINALLALLLLLFADSLLLTLFYAPFKLWKWWRGR